MGYLKNAGFVMLTLPQSDVQPLQLLVKTSAGTVDRLNASLEELLVPQSTAPPDIIADQPLPEVQGEEELNMQVKADVDFLKGLTNFFGLKGSGNFSYEQARVFKIKLNSPRQSKVNIIQLAGFIKDAKPAGNAGNIVDLLHDDQLYVITEVIKTKSFQVERADTEQTKAGIDINVPGIAEGGASTDIDRQDSSNLTFEGDTPLTFAVKAYRILATSGGWFSSTVKYTIESAKDVERVREGNFYGEPLTATDTTYLKIGTNG